MKISKKTQTVVTVVNSANLLDGLKTTLKKLHPRCRISFKYVSSYTKELHKGKYVVSLDRRPKEYLPKYSLHEMDGKKFVRYIFERDSLQNIAKFLQKQIID